MAKPQIDSFQSTPPRGRRRSGTAAKDMFTTISIHASAREATHRVQYAGRRKRISIHASAREATFFSAVLSTVGSISIHASAREATHRSRSGTCIRQISIHASAREATPFRLLPAPVPVYFNPRLREGGDEAGGDEQWISNNFNPRLREGGDGVAPVITEDKNLFQSTPPRGRRLSSRESRTSLHRFQSTPPRGRRLYEYACDWSKAGISIHASAREATVYSTLCVSRMSNFNPRLREGGDSLSPSRLPAVADFNPRLREGGDEHVSISPKKKLNFNPRLREGGDGFARYGAFVIVISIHASAREATALITKIHLKHHISFQHTVHKSPFNVNYPFQ